jgi:hypothetical protein
MVAYHFSHPENLPLPAEPDRFHPRLMIALLGIYVGEFDGRPPAAFWRRYGS